MVFKVPSPLNVMVEGNHWDQWFSNGFGARQPLVTMVFDDCAPLVRRCNGRSLVGTPEALLGGRQRRLLHRNVQGQRKFKSITNQRTDGQTNGLFRAKLGEG